MRHSQFTLEQVEATKRRQLPNIWDHWLRLDGFRGIDIQSAFDKYHIGVSKKEVRGGMYSPIFWQIDFSGNVIDGRTVGICQDGRIVYKKISSASYRDRKDYHLFGEHLLLAFPGRPVKIYPDEMRSVRESILNPEFNCMAMTHRSQQTRQRIKLYIPDTSFCGC
jgi:hypothetical protein